MKLFLILLTLLLPLSFVHKVEAAEKSTEKNQAWQGVLKERVSSTKIKTTHESSLKLTRMGSYLRYDLGKTSWIVDLKNQKAIHLMHASKEVYTSWLKDTDMPFPNCSELEWNTQNACLSKYQLQATRMQEDTLGTTTTVFEGQAEVRTEKLKVRAWIPNSPKVGSPILKWMTIHPSGDVREYTLTEVKQITVQPLLFSIPKEYRSAIPLKTQPKGAQKSTPKTSPR